MKSLLSNSRLAALALLTLAHALPAQAGVLGMLVTGESASEQVRSELIDGDSSEAEIAIKVPAQLNTGNTLYLTDRVPGEIAVADLMQAIDAKAQPQGLQITKNKVELLMFPREPDQCWFPVPGIAGHCMFKAKLSRTVTSEKGLIRFREYRLKLADVLGGHMDAFLAGSLTIALQSACREAGTLEIHRCETLISNGN